jgi:hypothetical protein
MLLRAIYQHQAILLQALKIDACIMLCAVPANAGAGLNSGAK